MPSYMKWFDKWTYKEDNKCTGTFVEMAFGENTGVIERIVLETKGNIIN
jgi:hypothetical protein